MGRKKKPVEVKKLQNTYRPDRESDISRSILEDIPVPSERIADDDSKIIYYQYCSLLRSEKRLTQEAIILITDLVWWESKRKYLETDLQNDGMIHRYYDKNGKLKHSQPTGAFSALRQATSEIDRLRRRLNITSEVPKKATRKNPFEENKAKNW